MNSVGTVVKMWRFPIKGLIGHAVDHLGVRPECGAVGDRIAALRSRPSNTNAWAKKDEFLVCMNTPKIAPIKPVFLSDKGGQHGYAQLDPEFLADVARRLGLEKIEVQETDGTYTLHDTKNDKTGGFVSYLNLNTWDEFVMYAYPRLSRRQLDPRRLRINVWARGIPAFEELTWVNRVGRDKPGSLIVEVGGIRHRVDDVIERCPAVNTGPDDEGVADEGDDTLLKVLAAFMRDRGYRSPKRGVPQVMGILAQPLDVGTIRLDSKIQLVA